MRVLVVDDDAYVRLILGVELPEVELIEAVGVTDGYELAMAEKPDGIIVDLHLQDGDGLVLVQKLRRSTTTSRIPILVLTAGHDEAHREEILRAGADEYVAKPFQPAELVDRLAQVLLLPMTERSHRRREHVQRLREGTWVDDHSPDDGTVIDLDDEREAVGADRRSRWWRR
jgi:DNA-binding response OmpR family regulator